MAVVSKAHRNGDHLLVVFLRNAFTLALRGALLGFLRLVLGLPALHLLGDDFVVDPALLGIGEDGVGLADFLERRVGLCLTAKVAVGVPLHRGTAIGALDFVQGRVRLHAEGRVDGRHGGRGGCQG